MAGRLNVQDGGGPTRRALGIDLAWGYLATTGVCALGLTSGEWRVVAHDSGRLSDDQIAAWVATHASGCCILAIDAPLFVPNATGTRPCDREVARRYWSYKIGVHACNRTRFPRPRGELICQRLEAEHGFHEVLSGCEGSLLYFETYPHPAIVNLLRLDERVRYKKGPVALRQANLARLAADLGRVLPALDPPLLADSGLDDLLRPTRQGLRGRALKQAEDAIDALVCAYAAAYWIAHGRDGSEVVGRPGEGMMIFPSGPGRPGRASAPT